MISLQATAFFLSTPEGKAFHLQFQSQKSPSEIDAEIRRVFGNYPIKVWKFYWQGKTVVNLCGKDPTEALSQLACAAFCPRFLDPVENSQRFSLEYIFDR